MGEGELLLFGIFAFLGAIAGCFVVKDFFTDPSLTRREQFGRYVLGFFSGAISGVLLLLLLALFIILATRP